MWKLVNKWLDWTGKVHNIWYKTHNKWDLTFKKCVCVCSPVKGRLSSKNVGVVQQKWVFVVCVCVCATIKKSITCWRFGTLFFPFSWECHHPNWLSLHHFSEGLRKITRKRIPVGIFIKAAMVKKIPISWIFQKWDGCHLCHGQVAWYMAYGMTNHHEWDYL